MPSICITRPEEKKDGESPGKSETSNSQASEKPMESKQIDGKPIDNQISTESSKQKVLTKSEPVLEKVSALKPANIEIEAEKEKVSKKTESKSQKSLFDF
jgi:hypothetical protein